MDENTKKLVIVAIIIAALIVGMLWGYDAGYHQAYIDIANHFRTAVEAMKP